MEYGGAMRTLGKDKDGNVTVQTETGDIIEHAPVSKTADSGPVPSLYSIKDNSISFAFPTDYDHSQTLIIDPWVTIPSVLTINNLGTSVDYDASGDLYVYGAGGSNSADLTNYHKVAKYDTSGNSLWVFMGSVPAIGWTTVDGTPRNDLGNIKVDRNTNKIYVSAAYNNGGVQAIRLTSAGLYDNFETALPDSSFTEIWSFLANCVNGSLLALGGSSNTNASIGLIDTVSGAITSSNVTLINSRDQDVVSGTYDAYGNLYMIMASYVYTQRKESNASYLYYYDGYNLKAFNLLNGSAVGTPDTIAGYTPLWQGGIVADNCNHLYVGGKGAIKTFTFDGSNFIPEADIPLGTGFSNDTILDVKYNPTNKLLYVTGPNIVGTYPAVYADSCSERSAAANIYTTSVTSNCNEASLLVTPVSGLTNPIISYVWEDTAGNILRQTAQDSILTDTFVPASSGRYIVHALINLNCSQYASTDSVDIYAVVAAFLFLIASYAADKARCFQSLTMFPEAAMFGHPEEILPRQSFFYNGTIYDTSGVYITSLASVNGCDSSVILTLTVRPPIYDTIVHSICSGDSIIFGGIGYHAPGTYHRTQIGSYGCDSITTLILTVLPFSYDTIVRSICSGDSVLFNGSAHYTSGYYSQVLTGSNSCDSIVTLHLTVNRVSHDTIPQGICSGDSFIFGGMARYAAGYYSQTMTGSNSCDSIATLHLMVRQISYDTIRQSICTGDSLVFGASVYRNSGFYSRILTGSNGCDSIATLHLVIKPLSYDTVSQSMCNGDSFIFGGSVLHSSGHYSQILTSINGCDSIVTLNLSINQLPTVGWTQKDTEAACRSNTLLSGGAPSGGYYSGPYVRGDSIINPPGDTSFFVSYFYTDINGCSGSAFLRFTTTICTGISEIQEASNIHIYPNPTNGFVNVDGILDFKAEYRITDIIGQQIQQGRLLQNANTIDIRNLPAGLYMLEVNEDWMRVVKKVVKE
ncbi:unnamed protein product [Sphagnum balticum]